MTDVQFLPLPCHQPSFVLPMAKLSAHVHSLTHDMQQALAQPRYYKECQEAVVKEGQPSTTNFITFSRRALKYHIYFINMSFVYLAIPTEPQDDMDKEDSVTKNRTTEPY